MNPLQLHHGRHVRPREGVQLHGGSSKQRVPRGAVGALQAAGVRVKHGHREGRGSQGGLHLERLHRDLLRQLPKTGASYILVSVYYRVSNPIVR